MSKESYSLPQDAFVCEMQHKYAVGDKVRVKDHHRYNGAKGEIVKPMPWLLVAPGYDVRINGVIVAVSERSLERIEHENN